MKKERWQYTADEIALLSELYQVMPPLPWKDIAARFPGRTVHALRDKAKQLGLSRPTDQPERPRLLANRAEAPADREDQAWASKAGKASIRLGVAIDAMLARQGRRMAA